jgi:hypothetical protein
MTVGRLADALRAGHEPDPRPHGSERACWDAAGARPATCP